MTPVASVFGCFPNLVTSRMSPGKTMPIEIIIVAKGICPIHERSEFEKYRNMRIVYDPETLEIKKTYPMMHIKQSTADADRMGLVATDGAQYLELRKKRKAMDEAEYQGRKVKLGKPMRGDVKKFKVYVRDPKTKNIKKVNFGDPNMKIKKSNPARRRSFRARHNCDNPGPRTKARYWSCRKW